MSKKNDTTVDHTNDTPEIRQEEQDLESLGVSPEAAHKAAVLDEGSGEAELAAMIGGPEVIEEGVRRYEEENGPVE